VSHRLAASSPQISRARARTCSRSISSGADVGPGRSFPVAHRVGWEPLTPTSFASWPPPKASTRKRTLLPKQIVGHRVGRSAAAPGQCLPQRLPSGTPRRGEPADER